MSEISKISFSYLNSHRSILTKEEIDSSPILTIIKENGDLFQNETIVLNAGGIINENANLNDGVTLFGNINSNCDFVLSESSLSQIDSYQSYPYIFAIYYQKQKKQYYIRTYSGEGSDSRIMFVKLTQGYDLVLKQKEIISIGNTLLQLTPLEECLEVYFITKTEEENIKDTDMKRIYDPKEISIITLGRDDNCTYVFKNDKSFSRIQTTIIYENGNWVVKDGSSIKGSTNGTWVFGIHSFEIKSGMTVEILTSKLRFDVSN